jgi:hypothetical protein
MGIIDKFLEWMNTYKADIYINIIAGIIASFIVLLGQTLVRTLSLIIASFFTLRYQLRALWYFKRPQRIYVVSGAIATDTPTDVKTAILAGPDADAANTLVATIGLIYPKALVSHVYSSALPKEFYKENLIVVGGPVNNTCSKLVLDQVKEMIHFDGFQLFDSTGQYSATYDENDNALVDYGIVLRISNPFDPTKDLILVAGCDTYGVLGAATLISLKEEVSKQRSSIQKMLGFKNFFSKKNYYAIVQCSVLGNDISQIKIVKFSKFDSPIN